ncbi:FMN-dependent dehydrogenase [Xylaria bambusicola]|uniref:FMN-dependent dehydrogenase n=1 Tax=Xylaria bambusicola TaxID=326684 RepID=UPI0020073C56|nr:FMN-dependent dehydrogenase [Xylaria bambusicola]KAI0527767.1 FMN-dependent dehydrogenase [Xylaria bambusicola]
MRSFGFLTVLAAIAAAYDVWVNEVDTGLEKFLYSTNWTEGTQPALKDMRAISDFDFAARQKLEDMQYSFYRTAAGGEWSYRNNLEVWSKVRFRPQQLSDVTKVNETSKTTILGYEFSAPIFIAPAARGVYGHERAELNFIDAAASENILYIPSIYASKSIEEIAAGKKQNNNTLNGPQVTFQQLYTNVNLSVTWDQIKRAEQANAKALVWTVDALADSTRHRAARYDTTNANSVTSKIDWEIYDQIRDHTKLPVIIKGISSVENAMTAVEKGAKAIYISNHGGRQVEYSPSPLEIAYEIHRNAPEIFQKVEVLADSGVRYGTDVLKLLALGVKAVGMGRPFMYANTYGVEGVEKAIQLMKTEIEHDAAQIGISDIHNIPSNILNLRQLENEVYLINS